MNEPKRGERGYWLTLWVDDPPSADIAAGLNARKAEECEHRRNPCYLRCGVMAVRGKWLPISKALRLQWKAEMEARLTGNP